MSALDLIARPTLPSMPVEPEQDVRGVMRLTAGEGRSTPSQAIRRLTPEQEEMAYRNKIRSLYPDLDEKKVESWANFGLATKRGREATAKSKLLGKGLAKYWGYKSKEDTARDEFQSAVELYAPKRAELEAAGSPELWAPYQAKLDKAKRRMDRATENARGMREVLKKQLGANAKYLDHPAAIFSYMNGLAGAQPFDMGGAEDLLDEGDDDELLENDNLR